MADRNEEIAGKNFNGSGNNKATNSSYPDQNKHIVSQGDSIENKSTKPTMPSKTYNLLVDKVPYLVKATPYHFNEEIRYTVSVNGGSEHVFTWDSEIKRLRAIDDEASELPDTVEDAISQKLQSGLE